MRTVLNQDAADAGADDGAEHGSVD
jgi:hypothetical protein